MRDLAVVLLAAGEGARLGQNTPKAFVPLMGKPLLEHALINLVSTDALAHVSLVAHDDYHDVAEELADRYSTKYVNIVVVEGGEVTRQDSVRNGLAAVPDDLEVVLVHDTARAFATAELFERVAAAVRESGKGVVPVLPVVDTIKRAEAELILETVDRSELRIAQTPQGFPIPAFKAAHALAGAEYTDDAALFQAAGGTRVLRAVNTKYATDVPQSGGSQQGIHDGVAHGVTIRVTV